jgi:hypothetical protein
MSWRSWMGTRRRRLHESPPCKNHKSGPAPWGTWMEDQNVPNSESDIRRTLKRLSRQRVGLVLQPGNVWVIENAVEDNEQTDTALKTAYMRGWVKPIENAVPKGKLTPEGALPSGNLFQGVGPLWQLTASGHNSLRETLFHALHRRRWGSHLRLAHEQMKVLRHDDVSQNDKAVLFAQFFENVQKQITPLIAVEPRLSVIATAGDEVQIPCAVVTPQTRGHQGRLNPVRPERCDGQPLPPLAKSARSGAPCTGQHVTLSRGRPHCS